MTTPTIRLAGEAAEAFDHQNAIDRQLLKDADDFIAFRPQIEGEFDTDLVVGTPRPVLLRPGDSDDASTPWVCVVDQLRALGACDTYSGCRTRFPCFIPLNDYDRKLMREAVVYHLRTQVELLRTVAPDRKSGRGFTVTSK